MIPALRGWVRRILTTPADPLDAHYDGTLPAPGVPSRGFPVYVVGDPDPTPHDLHRLLCGVDSPEGFYCTWSEGHDHPQHIAGDFVTVCAVWDAEVTS